MTVVVRNKDLNRTVKRQATGINHWPSRSAAKENAVLPAGTVRTQGRGASEVDLEES